MSRDIRNRQARTLWKRGWAAELGINTLDGYLETIPAIPQYTAEQAERFPRLILVDRRATIQHICALLRVSYTGPDFVNDDDQFMNDTLPPVYWMRCQVSRYLGQFIYKLCWYPDIGQPHRHSALWKL